jgi:3-oxoacyl-[acyl-carrier-protein] synthase-1
MSTYPVAIVGSGLVTAVGLNAPSSCAAIRAKLTNPIQTRFLDSHGERLNAHSVPLETPWRGAAKLSKMAAMAIRECLELTPLRDVGRIPLLLCVAERERPGRTAGLDDELFELIQQELQVEFSDRSLIVPHGRAAVGTALLQARRMLAEGSTDHVLIAATDSLLNAETLKTYDDGGRLLTPENSNGFIPGEGAAAVLVAAASTECRLQCSGIGMAVEPATVDSELPLRADGLSSAIRYALADAESELEDVDFRMADLSGEQYYFKEAALSLTRVLRARKETFDLWHPAECIGETGSTIGVALLVVAEAACRKGYAGGPRLLCHMGTDSGQRSALILQWRDH